MSELRRIPERPENPKPLGRHLWHDDRNRLYPIRTLLPDNPPIRKLWWRRGVFDQGSESSCTAQAAAGVLSTSPFRLSQPHRASLTAIDEPQERYTLYREAQRQDPWEGEGYEGSSTDAPFRVLRDRGAIREWRWCFGVQDVLDTLRYHGPVAIGTNWYESMFDADRTGRIEIAGGVAGGHAYQLLGDDPDDRRVDAINSWGDWGRAGRFYLTYDQLERLLGEQGEAVTVVV